MKVICFDEINATGCVYHFPRLSSGDERCFEVERCCSVRFNGRKAIDFVVIVIVKRC